MIITATIHSSSLSNTSDSSYTSQDGSSSSYSSSTNADSQAQSITMLVNGVARSADPIANSYSRGRHTLRANTTKKEDGSYNDSTFVIPISVFTSAYNATRTSDEIFKLMIETPIASTAIPANITSIISNYTTLVRLHEAPFSIKVTIIDKSTTSPTDAISSVVEFKLELIDKNGKIIIEISEFDGIMEKIIPVNIRKPAYWGVWMRKDGRSSWTFVPAKWTASGVVVSNTTNSEYVVVEYKSKFTDVKKDQWYYENITHAASKRLVQGRNTDGTVYDPEGTVTRAEFVAMVVRALRLPDAKSTTTSYTDVKDSDWFIRDGTLMSAKSAGLLGLLEVNGEFKPNQSISREEMAYILARAAAYCSVKADESVDLKARFEDFETIDNKYNTHVETVISLKLMQGMSATEFWGKSSVTRAQAATALINMCKIFDWID